MKGFLWWWCRWEIKTNLQPFNILPLPLLIKSCSFYLSMVQTEYLDIFISKQCNINMVKFIFVPYFQSWAVMVLAFLSENLHTIESACKLKLTLRLPTVHNIVAMKGFCLNNFFCKYSLVVVQSKHSVVVAERKLMKVRHLNV